MLTGGHIAGYMLTKDAIPQYEHSRVSTHAKSRGIYSIIGAKWVFTHVKLHFSDQKSVTLIKYFSHLWFFSI
jgi:hypothetical protein